MRVSLENNPARLAARAAGEKTFDPGPDYLCKHFHRSLRFVISGQCLTCTNARNAAKSTGRPRGRPPSKSGGETPARAKRVTAIVQAKHRLNRAEAHAVADYNNSVDGRERARYLNSLLPGLEMPPAPMSCQDGTVKVSQRQPFAKGARHEFKKVPGR